MTMLTSATDWYLEETIATATPARLLTLLYDRLARDLAQGRASLLAGNRDEAGCRIVHAREILTELLATLDGEAWDGAADLARVYAWMLSQLVTAQVQADAAVVASVHELVVQLALTWHEAADVVEGKRVAS
jgi:flagellar protein FliS